MKKLHLILIFSLCFIFIASAQKEEEVFVFQVNQNIAILSQYNGDANRINIPTIYKGKPVTAISSYIGKDKQRHGAFEGSGVESISIPNSIVRLGKNAFYNCEDIKSITLPSSISIIEEGVFEGCSGLQKIEIPNGVFLISNRLFAGCSGLKEIILPATITSIDNEAFVECSSLTRLTIPKNVAKIGTTPFADCSKLVEVIIEAMKPPKITDDFLEGTSNALRIKVPQAQLDIYKTTDIWKDFATQIVGF